MIGVSNIMLIIIKERTSEIGIRRAIGAPPIDIVRQIVLESMVLTTIAGYLGLVIGVGILEGLSTLLGEGGMFFSNPTVDINVAVKALAVLVVSGALAGLIPAYRALRIRPIEAVRTE